MQKIIVFISLVLLAFHARGDSKAVMLFLSAKDQPDTLGYNLVSELPALLYEEVSEGRIPLWDSPEKQIRIQPASLKAIEESNSLTFSASPQLFILEKWTIEKKNLKFEVAGFFFSDRNAKGEEISYGFVAYHDAELALTSTSISANANGSCFSTFKYIILNHLYFYNIVQFGNKKINSLDESQKLKSEYAEMLSTGLRPSSSSKKIVYRVERPGEESVSLESGMLTYQVLKMMEDFLNGNKEVYLNLGGDKFTDFMGKEPIRVLSFDAEEIWTRNDTGFDSQVLTVTIQVQQGSLTPLTAEDLWKMNMHTEESSLAVLLKQKEFYFRILSINAERITKEDSPKYLKALKKFSWNQLKEVVRYE